MLNPKYQRVADRIRELIDEGNALCKTARNSDWGAFIPSDTGVHAWGVKADNILTSVFGAESAHYQHFHNYKLNNNLSMMQTLIGIMTGALSDLENGFLQGQEFIVASEVFDSVLDQAKYLNDKGFKDAAAVLGRTILEDALKRLARANSVPDNTRASVINQALRQAGVYQQHQERLVQSRLDIGNDAAHGDFHKFTQENVREMIEDVERFLAFHFTN